MAELTTLARPYARAAFELARDQGQLPAWAQILGTLAAVVQDATVAKALSAPSLTALGRSQILEGTLGDLLNAQQVNFLRTLADNHRLQLLPHIHQIFDGLKADYEKTLSVEVISAFELDPSWQAKLASVLAQKLDRQISVCAKVDKSLLGGAIVRAGDTVIDGSVRGRLAKLADGMNA